MKKIVLVVFLLLFVVTGFTQTKKATPKIPSVFCIATVENKLYQMINEYRGRYDLQPIPLSKSLCYVASLHVKDLAKNHPDQGSCNSHSWSDKGNWKPFCYPKDETKTNSVWDKPKELTGYPGKGYEIIYWESETLDIDSVMNMFREVDYFNNFLTNTGKWAGKNWNAIGIAIFGNYVSAWFGEVPDPAGPAKICGMQEPLTAAINPPDKVKTTPAVKDTAIQQKIQPDSVKTVKSKTGTKTTVTATTPAVTPDKMKTGVYYIIIKSQQSMEILDKSRNDAVKKGFADAKIINGDKLRLSVGEYRQKAAADSALREIRKTYKDAWILVK